MFSLQVQQNFIYIVCTGVVILSAVRPDRFLSHDSHSFVHVPCVLSVHIKYAVATINLLIVLFVA